MTSWIARAFGFGAAVIDWRGTILLTAMRSAAGGFMWGIIVLMLGGDVSTAVMFMFFGVLIGTLFYAPAGIVFAGIAKLFPPAGLVCLVTSLYMVAGDPILWIVQRFKPDWIPVEKFNILNFNTVIFVLNQEVIDTVRDGVTGEVSRAASSAMDRLSGFKRS